MHDNLHTIVDQDDPDLCASNPPLLPAPPPRTSTSSSTLPLQSDLRDLDNLRIDLATAPLAVSEKIKLIVDPAKERG